MINFYDGKVNAAASKLSADTGTKKEFNICQSKLCSRKF
ncbi:MAG: hypothetical protein CM15mV22_0880 [Eurybiavirus sp.]|nr:MAG: hypothetical protein CM15mV22_0880 [Eurybiavirus sp.]